MFSHKGSDTAITTAESEKLSHITITNPANLSTMESGITTINNKLAGSSSSGLKTLTTTNLNGINGILNHSIDSNLKAFVDANSNKVGITTTQANNITTNNAKVGITTTQANNITTNNSKTGITSSQASIITQNSSKLNMTVNSAMKIAVDANTNAYPQFTNFKRLYNQGGDVYNDGKIKFAWNATTRQLQFYVLDIPSGEYLTGGVVKNEGSSRTAVHTYLSQGESTAYKYFTTPQTSASSSSVNTTFNLTTSYSRIEYFLHPYNELVYPSYRITILIGSSNGYHQFSIKKFSN
tara:strand:+ start:106 stop:990 length:885 start_codon:yes stop_codon:yes gene_type:complete